MRQSIAPAMARGAKARREWEGREIVSRDELPYSRDAEVAFLGAILLDSDGSSDEMDRLEWTDFLLPFHQVIFRTLKHLKAEGKPINDLVVLHDALEAAGKLDAAGGAYIATLCDLLPKVANLSYYAERIKTTALARKAIYRRQAEIERLLNANGNLADVLQEIDSAHIGKCFGQKESRSLFRTPADLTKESSTAEFLVKPYILAGAVTELVAKIKAGKTTYALGEIVGPALELGAVVYLTEQPATSFRVALERAHLLGRENLFVLPFNAVMGLDWRGIASLVLEKCRETSAALVVVDTLSHFAGLDGDSENDSGAALTSMKPLQEAAGQGIAVLSIRHERKSGGEIGDAGRGSSAFGNGRPTIRKIECISRFEGLPTEALFEYVDGHYQYLGTETEISEREAEAVILSSAPECQEKAKTLDELLDGSDAARTTSQRVAKRLAAEGKLIQIGRGRRGNAFRYFLAEKVSAQKAHIYGQKESEALLGS
jgi:hypothetical protein